MSEPVVILYRNSTNRHCRDLLRIWRNIYLNDQSPYDVDDIRDEPSIMDILSNICPNFRFIELINPTFQSQYYEDRNLPIDLIRYIAWIPMIILIPGPLFDRALLNSNTKIIHGVKIMNGILDDTKHVRFVTKYNDQRPDEFGRWLRDSLLSQDFQRVQNCM